MFQLGMIEAMQAEREREIQEAMRRRRLLRPQDRAVAEPTAGQPGEAVKGRTLSVRAGPTGG